MFRNRNYGSGTYGDYYFLESSVPERSTAASRNIPLSGKSPIYKLTCSKSKMVLLRKLL